MTNSDELLAAIKKYVQTMIDLDADKKNCDPWSFQKHMREDHEPAEAELKKLLEKIFILGVQNKQKDIRHLQLDNHMQLV